MNTLFIIAATYSIAVFYLAYRVGVDSAKAQFEIQKNAALKIAAIDEKVKEVMKGLFR